MVDQFREDPLPKDISSVSRIESIPNMAEDLKQPETEAQNFAALMQGGPGESGNAATKTAPISPFDLAQIGAKPITTPSMQTLVDQTSGLHNSLSTVQNQLSTPGLSLKSSQKYLVQSKLSDVNTHLRAANTKLGVNAPEVQMPKGSGPLAQYLGYINDGMNQLDTAKQQLAQISSRGTSSLSPADFMLLQLKFNKAQQELDFTSTLLTKSIEGLKTIMNVQI